MTPEHPEFLGAVKRGEAITPVDAHPEYLGAVKKARGADSRQGEARRMRSPPIRETPGHRQMARGSTGFVHGQANNDNIGGRPVKVNSRLSIADRDRIAMGGRGLHLCGERPVAELLRAVAERDGSADWILSRLAEFTALPPSQIAAIGADRLPPLPIREIAQ